MKILSNKAKCLNCGDTIESKHVHDFQVCSCWYEDHRQVREWLDAGNKFGVDEYPHERHGIAVDGGRHYLKRSGSWWEMEDLSDVEGIDDEQA